MVVSDDHDFQHPPVVGDPKAWSFIQQAEPALIAAPIHAIEQQALSLRGSDAGHGVSSTTSWYLEHHSERPVSTGCSPTARRHRPLNRQRDYCPPSSAIHAALPTAS